MRAAVFCNDYAASQQWDNALRNCDESLLINPNALSTRFLRGRILYEMERNDEALEEFERVLAMDPFHEEALQIAGYIATVSGDDDAGRDYYRRYLDINPGNVTIRMRIAFELAQASDPVGAMQFIEVGLDVDPGSVDLLDQYGGFAFAAARDAQEEYELSTRDAPDLAPEATEYYREGIEAYTKVFDAQGAETPPDRLRSIIAAYIQIKELDSAIRMSERVLETHGQEDGIWSLYASALQSAGRLEDTITALDRLLEVNPRHPNAQLRQGSWLIEANRLEDAAAVLSEATEKNPAQAEQAANLIFSEAYTHGFQEQNYEYAITGMAAARPVGKKVSAPSHWNSSETHVVGGTRAIHSCRRTLIGSRVDARRAGTIVAPNAARASVVRHTTTTRTETPAAPAKTDPINPARGRARTTPTTAPSPITTADSRRNRRKTDPPWAPSAVRIPTSVTR